MKLDFRQLQSDLQNLDRENPGNWPLWFRIAVIVLVSIVLVIGGMYYLVKPRSEELDRVRAEEPGLLEQLRGKARKAAALELYKAQLAKMEQEFAELLRQLPGKAEVPNLLDEIGRVRISSALEEELFQPSGETVKEFYAELPNRTSVVGTYHEIGTFVSGIASLTRIVTVDNLELRPLAKGNAKSSDLRLTATIKTYRYLEEGEGAR